MVNPAADTTRPSPEKKEMEVLDSDEVKRLLSLNDEWRPLFRTLIGTGLRIGEALALRWSDLDMDKHVINIMRTPFRIGNKLAFGEPKTDESRRHIQLSPHNRVWETINKQLVRQLYSTVAQDTNVIDITEVKTSNKKLTSDALVFPNHFGNPTDLSTPLHAIKRSVTKIAANINSDDDPKARRRWDHLATTLRVHDLRHTAATLMHQN